MTKQYRINVIILIVVLSLSLFSTSTAALQINQGNIENITEQLTQYNRLIGAEDDKAATVIKDKMLEYGLDVQLEDFPFQTTSKKPLNMTSSNVIGIKKGASDQIIIIGAHYDSMNLEGFEAPGADDNAAGVAVMLEIAREFQSESFNRTIYFIAFSGEEYGLMGSKNWLEQHGDLHDNIVAMITIDTVAYGDRLLMGSSSNWLLDVFPSEANLEKVNVSFISSDNIPFLEQNLPAVRLMDVGNINHHTSNDTISTLNFSLARESAQIVAAGVYNLATTDDLIPPEVSVEVKNGTVYYNTSEKHNVRVFVDDMNLGYIESGKMHLPAGKHTVKIRVTDYMGNRGSDELIVNVNKTYYIVPTFEGKSVITIPWKRTEKEIEARGHREYGQLSISLSYKVDDITDNITVIGFIDGIKIDDLPPSQFVIFTPGKHTFEVVAFNESGVEGIDNITFSNKISHQFQNEVPYTKSKNHGDKIFNLLNTLSKFVAVGLLIVCLFYIRRK